MTDSLDTPVVVVKRWTRYGNDRAYAALGELQLGYRDLHTGVVVCEVEAHRALLEAATTDLWHRAEAARYQPRHATPVAPTPPTERVQLNAPTLLPDRDLMSNRPGEAHARPGQGTARRRASREPRSEVPRREDR